MENLHHGNRYLSFLYFDLEVRFQEQIIRNIGIMAHDEKINTLKLNFL